MVGKILLPLVPSFSACMIGRRNFEGTSPIANVRKLYAIDNLGDCLYTAVLIHKLGWKQSRNIVYFCRQ